MGKGQQRSINRACRAPSEHPVDHGRSTAGRSELATFGMMFAVAMQNWFAQQAADWPAIAAQFNRFATGGFARDNGQ